MHRTSLVTGVDWPAPASPAWADGRNGAGPPFHVGYILVQICRHQEHIRHAGIREWRRRPQFIKDAQRRRSQAMIPWRGLAWLIWYLRRPLMPGRRTLHLRATRLVEWGVLCLLSLCSPRQKLIATRSPIASIRLGSSGGTTPPQVADTKTHITPRSGQRSKGPLRELCRSTTSPAWMERFQPCHGVPTPRLQYPYLHLVAAKLKLLPVRRLVPAMHDISYRRQWTSLPTLLLLVHTAVHSLLFVHINEKETNNTFSPTASTT